MTAIKIKTYEVKVRSNGVVVVTLPIQWVRDLGLTEGDKLDFYRDEEDRLIFCRAGQKPSDGADLSAGQARETAASFAEACGAGA